MIFFFVSLIYVPLILVDFMYHIFCFANIIYVSS